MLITFSQLCVADVLFEVALEIHRYIIHNLKNNMSSVLFAILSCCASMLIHMIAVTVAEIKLVVFHIHNYSGKTM